MRATPGHVRIFGLLVPSPAAASGGGDFIDIALIVFLFYCALVIVPHTVRAGWVLWKELRAARTAGRSSTADT